VKNWARVVVILAANQLSMAVMEVRRFGDAMAVSRECENTEPRSIC
jgi:hypothetical protein